MCDPRSARNVSRTWGHHVATLSRIHSRARPESATPSTTATASAISSTAMRMTPEASGASMLRFRLALENSSRSTSSRACTTVFVSESIVPDVMAAAGGTPWRWKKRTLTAMRAMPDGKARFM